MRFSMRLILSMLAMLIFPLAMHSPLRGAPVTHDRERAAIETILTTQQAAWNKGDLDAFVEGYWHSPDLTFSGTKRHRARL
jgi:hypothetical protein